MQLVAPAGSLSGLRSSINGGADAVYLGMPQFGARAKATNFDETTLAEAVGFAHLHGVKVFVTLNTLIKDGELKKAVSVAKFAYDMGVDAAIVQDIRFIELLKKTIPDFTLHASTQMGIHNSDGAKMLQSLGIKRAVLARETLPEDIVEIKNTGIEIEFFVQGALCIAFSGNCYFSSLASSYSGNRGKCMQLCRKPYMFHGNCGYYLSAKDLCLFDRLSQLEKLGVDAIKIEGRMRSDEYAYISANVYKSAMTNTDAVNALKTVFNRGDYCSAYLDEDAPFRVIYPKTQSNIGISVGKLSKVRDGRVYVNGFTPHKLDGYKLLRDGYEVCGASVRGGEICVDGKCKIGDELRRTFDGALSERVKSVTRKIPIKVDITISEGARPNAELSANGVSVTVIGADPIQSAQNRALTLTDIVRSFDKVSEYPYEPQINVTISDNAFMPISDLNGFRRQAYSKLYDKLISSYKIARSNLIFKGFNYNKFTGHGKMLMVQDIKQLTDKILSIVDYIVINPRDYSTFEIPKIDKPVLLNLPIVMRGKDKAVIISAIERKEIYGIVSNNLYSLNITDKPILLGPGHNIIGKTNLPHIRSFESDSVPSNADGVFSYAFGYAPIMTLCHCPYGKCINCSGTDELSDESGRKFKLRRYRTSHCYWQLLNCVPHNLTQKVGGNLFYDCTELAANQIEDVLTGKYIGQYTVGNINKGLK